MDLLGAIQVIESSVCRALIDESAALFVISNWVWSGELARENDPMYRVWEDIECFCAQRTKVMVVLLGTQGK